MKNSIKIISVFLVLSVSIFFLGGCGKKENTIETSSAPISCDLSPSSDLMADTSSYVYDTTPLVLNKEVENSQAGFDYVYYLPDEYSADSTEKIPLIVFLHGSGERGNIVDWLTSLSIFKQSGPIRKDPVMIVAPQCKIYNVWHDDINALNLFLDYILSKYNVDTKRIYLTGFSMGAFGIWSWGAQSSERFAAIAPVAGDMQFKDASLYKALKNMPVWAFAGEYDNIIDPSRVANSVNFLKAVGGKPRFSLVDRGDHYNICDIVYANQKLYDWLYKQTKK